MSQAPAMPLFTDAYLGDTMHLSLEEHGAYLKLLMIIWRNNGQPVEDDDKRIARMLGVSVPKWRSKLRPAIAPFFDLSEGTFRQKRLEKEWQYVSKYKEKQTKKSHAAVKARGLKLKESGQPTGYPGGRPVGSPEDGERVNPEFNNGLTTHTHKGNNIYNNNPSSARAREGYAFEGTVIRLTHDDHERWRKSFSNIPNLDALLESRDAWLADNPERKKSWFQSTAAWLAKKDAEAERVEDKPRSGLPEYTDEEIEEHQAMIRDIERREEERAQRQFGPKPREKLEPDTTDKSDFDPVADMPEFLRRA